MIEQLASIHYLKKKITMKLELLTSEIIYSTFTCDLLDSKDFQIILEIERKCIVYVCKPQIHKLPNAFYFQLH